MLSDKLQLAIKQSIAAGGRRAGTSSVRAALDTTVYTMLKQNITAKTSKKTVRSIRDYIHNAIIDFRIEEARKLAKLGIKKLTNGLLEPNKGMLTVTSVVPPLGKLDCGFTVPIEHQYSLKYGAVLPYRKVGSRYIVLDEFTGSLPRNKTYETYPEGKITSRFGTVLEASSTLVDTGLGNFNTDESILQVETEQSVPIDRPVYILPNDSIGYLAEDKITWIEKTAAGETTEFNLSQHLTLEDENEQDDAILVPNGTKLYKQWRIRDSLFRVVAHNELRYILVAWSTFSTASDLFGLWYPKEILFIDLIVLDTLTGDSIRFPGADHSAWLSVGGMAADHAIGILDIVIDAMTDKVVMLKTADVPAIGTLNNIDIWEQGSVIDTVSRKVTCTPFGIYTCVIDTTGITVTSTMYSEPGILSSLDGLTTVGSRLFLELSQQTASGTLYLTRYSMYWNPAPITIPPGSWDVVPVVNVLELDVLNLSNLSVVAKHTAMLRGNRAEYLKDTEFLVTQYDNQGDTQYGSLLIADWRSTSSPVNWVRPLIYFDLAWAVRGLPTWPRPEYVVQLPYASSYSTTDILALNKGKIIQIITDAVSGKEYAVYAGRFVFQVFNEVFTTFITDSIILLFDTNRYDVGAAIDLNRTISTSVAPTTGYDSAEVHSRYNNSLTITGDSIALFSQSGVALTRQRDGELYAITNQTAIRTQVIFSISDGVLSVTVYKDNTQPAVLKLNEVTAV